MTLKDDITATAKSQLSEAGTLAQEAANSRAFIYPFKGALYFFSHPSLYKNLTPLLWKTVLFSGAVFAGMSIFTFLPQLAICLIFGPLAPIAAGLLVLVESVAIIFFVGKPLLLGAVQEDLFDAVLVGRGHQQLVMKGRSVTNTASGAKKLGKTVAGPLQRFSKAGLIRYLVSLPLNAIPVVGTAMFLLFNGYKSGPNWHARYFQFKGFSKEEREVFVHKHRGSYTAFGLTTLVLDLIPVVGLVLTLTSTCGAALWASDMEKKREGKTEVPIKEARVEL